jgi:hypothetical protein
MIHQIDVSYCSCRVGIGNELDAALLDEVAHSGCVLILA